MSTGELSVVCGSGSDTERYSAKGEVSADSNDLLAKSRQLKNNNVCAYVHLICVYYTYVYICILKKYKHIHMYICHVQIHIYICIYIYIHFLFMYTYIEREGEREKIIYFFIYIYVCIRIQICDTWYMCGTQGRLAFLLDTECLRTMSRCQKHAHEGQFFEGLLRSGQ